MGWRVYMHECVLVPDNYCLPIFWAKRQFWTEKTVKNANFTAFTAFYGILKKIWSKKIFVLVWSDKVSLPEAQTTRHYDWEFFLTYESLSRGVLVGSNPPRFVVVETSKTLFFRYYQVLIRSHLLCVWELCFSLPIFSSLPTLGWNSHIHILFPALISRGLKSLSCDQSMNKNMSFR